MWTANDCSPNALSVKSLAASTGILSHSNIGQPLLSSHLNKTSWTQASTHVVSELWALSTTHPFSVVIIQIFTWPAAFFFWHLVLKYWPTLWGSELAVIREFFAMEDSV